MSTDDPTPLEIDVYEKHKAKMRESCIRTRSGALVVCLPCSMKPMVHLHLFHCLTNRHYKHWIITKCPSVNDILSEFPCLMEPNLVR